jgi:hypothetical protein
LIFLDEPLFALPFIVILEQAVGCVTGFSGLRGSLTAPLPAFKKAKGHKHLLVFKKNTQREQKDKAGNLRPYNPA